MTDCFSGRVHYWATPWRPRQCTPTLMSGNAPEALLSHHTHDLTKKGFDTLVTVLSEAELQTRAARPMSATPRPFVRWAGSKRALLAHLLQYLPREFAVYYEPFLGSGAMFFLVRPYHAVLNDSCPELMQTYLAVSTDAERVVAAARRSPLTKQDFYRVRANRSTDLWERAGEFLYLNRGCFNGLYRVNSRGEFTCRGVDPRHHLSSIEKICLPLRSFCHVTRCV